jgi:hypothetical protein
VTPVFVDSPDVEETKGDILGSATKVNPGKRREKGNILVSATKVAKNDCVKKLGENLGFGG